MKGKRASWWGITAMILFWIIVIGVTLTNSDHLTPLEHTVKGMAVGAALVLLVVWLISLFQRQRYK
jgi:hypothetical protein